MIVRRCFTPTTILVVLTLLGGFDGNAAERWSRQVSNSEWIPLANPRAASGQVSQGNTGSGLLPNPIQALSLPPPLQQQYQEQLIQLQKTQESIQKLLLLQQQLKAQQQILQSQTFLPSGFSNVEDEKRGLLPSSLGNLQTAPELLVPPQVASEALPPIYPPQNFLPHRPGHQQSHQDQNLEANRELSSLPVQGQVVLQHGEDVNVEDPREGPHGYVKQGGHRPGGKRPKIPQLPLIEGGGDEEEEVQLVYVPAETLAQKGQQPKRGRGRKPSSYHLHQQQHQQQRENQDGIEQVPLSPDQEAFARQVLHQIQKEHEEKAQFLKEERVKEFARLNEEQKALERKTRLQQEAFQREQELLRQKEAEKKRKELERLEEIARQRELDRIREAREKQRQEELERRRLSELRIKEEKRREEETRQRDDRQKQLEVLKQQSILEGQQEQVQENSQSQARRQQFADGTRPKRIRGRQRQRVNQYQEQPNYPEATTTPSPNQPPLSVYMGSSTSKLDTVKVTDVLRILKNAKTIAVLDNVGPDTPRVFVGPSNLDPPYGYAKFDLPYLSSIDHNRVERKVDKLPFFVAPLSFDPPPGYSKIPFPAPHIGSVVVNTLPETSEPITPSTEQNPDPTPLIEPNSYSDGDQIAGSVATTASYESPTTQSYSPESSGPKYESTYSTPASGSRFRFRQYYDNKPTSVSSSYYGEQSTTKTKPRTKQYYEQEIKSTTQSPKVDTTASYRPEYSNAPSFQDRTVGSQDPSTKEQDLAAQLALINQELAQQREPQRYNTEQYRPQANLAETYDVNDVRAPVGPAQYNLPAELPPISPHLPGLVNSLLDKQEENLPVTSTPPPTTTTTPPLTTTTTRVSSTTYRPRGRNRIVSTRSRTTTTPSSKTSTDRTRRPYNRSKSRFSTTTEDYHESSYEPTKAKTPETTQKYKAVEHRRPTSRTHKYRGRDRTSSQSAVHDRNIQSHQAATYENYPTQSDSQSDPQANASPGAYSPTNEAAPNLQKEISSHGAVSDFTRESYLPTTPTQTENYPPLREVTVQHGAAALVSDDYSRSQNYPQNRPQETRYHSGFEQLEKTPVNGFNYQVGNEESSDQAIPQRPKEYSRYQVKLESANYNLASTEDPRIRPGEEQYSPIYEVNVAQPQPQDYNTDGQNLIRDQILQSEDSKIESGVVKADANAQPIFVPLQHSKQEDYELPSTQTPLIEITTTSTTTPAPVIIRQRVRGRLGGRGHHESTVQTRPRGSQDEYVRFSAVNHDSSRGTGHRLREGSRTRTRTRPQSHGSQVQTEGNEYIKIHAVQQQRLIATTPPTTTTVPTTSVHPLEEDVDYGFIRPPSFRPVQGLQPVHPADNRFQAPITYRPPLSEIQHIISNDETAVESSLAHTLKNRPKYHQAPSRRPATKTFATTTTSTTTETIPIETTMLENTAYTVKPKTRLEDSRTRVRTRVRRPGKKRTTTTTESALEANNELPLDENYPRITSQQLVAVTETGQQQTLYEEDFEIPSQYVPNQNRPVQFYEETTGENYPPQEFILNFDHLPEQVPEREKYDQTQLASISSKKYSSRVKPAENAHSTGDIYGAESQWSTKLSKTSFQPSFASNHATDGAKRGRGKTRDDKNDENAPEIITAGPDVSFVTMVVSSDYQKRTDGVGDVDTMMDTAVFGRKTNAQEYTEKLNATTAVTSSSITTLQDMIPSEEDASSEARNWLRGKENNVAKQTDDLAQTTKKDTDSLPNRKGGTRRRRVRVRIRPAVDDFVTAESQHYNSAMNNLVQDRYKYNPIRESTFTTTQPIATTITTTTTTAPPTTQKSLLQDFLEEMLKNDEAASIPTHVTPVPTEFPVWTISTPITTTYLNDETTTLKESQTAIVMTVTPSNFDDITTTNGNSDGSEKATSLPSEQISQLSHEEVKDSVTVKSEEYRTENSQVDKIDRNDLENVGIITQRYKLPANYPGSETSKQVEDGTTGLPAARDKGKEHIMTLKRPEENIEENEAHPKNHRAKWSEVRYPSAFDKSQPTLKQHSATTSIPGFTTRNDGETSVKTLSDYVAAIFDSMKTVDGPGKKEEEEVAKVVEAKNESPTENSYRYNDITSVHEIGAKETKKSALKAITTTDSSRDAHTTQRVDLEEKATSPPEPLTATDMTTKESATTLESAVPISDATVNAITPPEETTKTLTTATSTEKTTTSLDRSSDNVDRANSTMAMLGKILRTSTTTRVSHMTEICYRGRCVMTRPKMEEATR